MSGQPPEAPKRDGDARDRGPAGPSSLTRPTPHGLPGVSHICKHALGWGGRAEEGDVSASGHEPLYLRSRGSSVLAGTNLYPAKQMFRRKNAPRTTSEREAHGSYPWGNLHAPGGSHSRARPSRAPQCKTHSRASARSTHSRARPGGAPPHKIKSRAPVQSAHARA